MGQRKPRPTASRGPKPVKVSYDKQIRPIFQAHCQGCHQPAKAGGAYVMTAFDRMLKGGESESPAIVPGKPGESHLVELVTPNGGKAEMPQNKPPLADSEIALITQWIAQGAVDDSPQNPGKRYDMEHPPEYTRLPVIPAVAFSPDGSLLAVAGFHEVLLWKADGSELVGRLVGLSERVESLAFSPDGKQLAVTGGRPARMGEVQVWDVAKRKLVLSVPVTFDTIYGVSWSPDGTKIAFGCIDNTVRAIDAKTGEQVLFLGSHTDWAQDTVFSADGSHLISVGRDMSAKLTEVATQRFVDNITSITPGALKGGLAAVARHPKRDEIVIGRLRRRAQAVPGLPPDDAGDRRRLQPDPRVPRAAGPGLQRGRQLPTASGSPRAAVSMAPRARSRVYNYEFDTALPANIKAIQEKVVTTRSAAGERGPRGLPQGGGQARSPRSRCRRGASTRSPFRPDGKLLAAAGGDGIVRLINPETGAIVKEFAPVAGQDRPRWPRTRRSPPSRPSRKRPSETETLPEGAVLAVARGSAQGDPAHQPGSPTFSSWSPASSRRERRSTPPGWSSRRSRPTSPRFRGRAWSGPGATARRRCRSSWRASRSRFR